MPQSEMLTAESGQSCQLEQDVGAKLPCDRKTLSHQDFPKIFWAPATLNSTLVHDSFIRCSCAITNVRIAHSFATFLDRKHPFSYFVTPT